MNTSSLSVVLGCLGLAVGSIGLVAQDIQGSDQRSANAEPQQTTRAATWPPHPLIAGVEFHDELLELISLGPTVPRRTPAPQPELERDEVRRSEIRRQETQPQTLTGPHESAGNLRVIRTVASPRSSRVQAVEIEFIDPDGRPYRRLYPVGGQMVAGDRIDEVAPDQAIETYGYSPRRSRRYGRSYNRRWR